MKKIDLGQTIQTVANVGVIAGIIFLAVELSQNTAMIQAQMNQSRADSAVFSAEAVFNSDYLPEILVALEQGKPLSDVQTVRYQNWLIALLRLQDNQYRQYREGLLGEDVERSVRRVVRVNIAPLGLARDRWEQVKLATGFLRSTPTHG